MNSNHTSDRASHPNQEFAKAPPNQRRDQTTKQQSPCQNILASDERMTRYTNRRRERTIQIQHQPAHGPCSNIHVRAARLQRGLEYPGVCSGFRIRKLLKGTAAPLAGPHAEPSSGTASPLSGDCETCRIRSTMKFQTAAFKYQCMECGCCARPWFLSGLLILQDCILDV